jgi:hypothetical protein
MKALIVFVISNYSLTFLLIGLRFSLVAAREPIKPPLVVEKLLAWHVFWAIGVGYLYNFVMHVCSAGKRWLCGMQLTFPPSSLITDLKMPSASTSPHSWPGPEEGLFEVPCNNWPHRNQGGDGRVMLTSSAA